MNPRLQQARNHLNYSGTDPQVRRQQIDQLMEQ